MDPFETRLKSLPLRRPSVEFGKSETLVVALRRNTESMTLIQRIETMSWKSSAAALLGLAASIALAYLAVSGFGGGSAAFAQVLEKLRAAQTLSFESLMTRQNDGKVLSRGRNRYMAPGKVRIEFDGEQNQQSYIVFDTTAGKMLIVDVQQKTAQLSPLKGPENMDIAGRAIEEVRSLAEKQARSLGKKLIEGVEAKGFSIDRGTATTTVWADAAGNPLRIEILESNNSDGLILQVWTKIKLDEPLDPKLFSTEPPPGINVKPFLPVDFNKPPVHFVAECLRIYAKHMDGKFPPQLQDAINNAIKPLTEKLKPAEGESPSEDLMQVAFHGAGMAAVTMRSKAGEDWQYYPGHKLGEKDHMIFWFRDKREDRYWAVFGDLRVEEVPSKDLPPTPMEKPANE